MRIRIEVSIYDDDGESPRAVEYITAAVDDRMPYNTIVGSMSPLASRAIGLALGDYAEVYAQEKESGE